MKYIRNFLSYICKIFVKIPIYLRGIAIFFIIVLISNIFNKFYEYSYNSRTIYKSNGIKYIELNSSDESNLNNNTDENIIVDKENNKINGKKIENLKSFQNRKNKKSKEALKDTELDYFFGDEDAKITVIEYSSFKCPYCISFYEKNMDDINTNYILKNKIKYIKRIIIQKETMLGILLSHCALQENRYNLLKDLYLNLNDWTNTGKQKRILKEIAFRNGFNEKTYQECIDNKTLANRLLEKQKYDLKELNISSIPTFFINEKMEKGALSYQDFANKIDNELKNIQ